MNQAMWRDNRTQDNLNKLLTQDFGICGPGSGEQACGDIGLGRMLEPLEILEIFSSSFDKGVMSGKNVLITAGPTQEPIDPVRFITNRSSGKMGYSLAHAAIEQGAQVTLISGPVNIEPPSNCNVIAINTAKEMSDAVKHHIKRWMSISEQQLFRIIVLLKLKIPK
jgi:phosphopantothenoylcysteine decarboxylase/phosphopantothenate--cysteine ligase